MAKAYDVEIKTRRQRETGGVIALRDLHDIRAALDIGLPIFAGLEVTITGQNRQRQILAVVDARKDNLLIPFVDKSAARVIADKINFQANLQRRPAQPLK
ncbi:MAG: hypothetical protein WAV41_06085 [Microgenomates group bacterium]